MIPGKPPSPLGPGFSHRRNDRTDQIISKCLPALRISDSKILLVICGFSGLSLALSVCRWTTFGVPGIFFPVFNVGPSLNT